MLFAMLSAGLHMSHGHRADEASERSERVRRSVSSRVILIEAPSLSVPLVCSCLPKTLLKEETSYEILYQAAPILLRNRSACQIDVRLCLGLAGRDCLAQKYALYSRLIPQGDCPLPRGHGRRRRGHLHLVLAGRPVRQGKYPLCLGSCALHESHPRRQSEERQNRRSQNCGLAARRHAADGLCLSRSDEIHP